MCPPSVIIILHHFSVTLILSISLYECFGHWPSLLSHRKFSLHNKRWSSQIKMFSWPVKADVSLTGCPISMLSVSCISANYPLLFTSLWSTLSPAIICLLPSDFVPTAFPASQSPPTPFLNIYPNVWHDLHTFPSHLPQLNLSTWQTSTLELHIYSFSCHWHFLFLAYKCQQVRWNGKRNERLIPQYQHQL